MLWFIYTSILGPKKQTKVKLRTKPRIKLNNKIHVPKTRRRGIMFSFWKWSISKKNDRD